MNEALKAYIIKNNLTLQEVADRTGLKTPSTVCQHLKGDRKISAQSALAYHKGLGIPLSDLRPDLWPEPATKEEVTLEAIRALVEHLKPVTA